MKLLIHHIKWIYTILIIVSVYFLILYLKIDISLLFSDLHFVNELLDEMWPPNMKMLWENNAIFYSILQTIAMAYAGTIFGGLIAFLLSMVASHHVFTNTLPGTVIKWLLSLVRVIPNLIIILIFVVAVGPGPFAGVLTILIASIGTLGKLYTESIENLDPTTASSLKYIGANNFQIFKYAVWPELLPSFITNTLYCFDINMRAAVGLGIFGGGGIGYKLYMTMRVLHYKDAVALILCIIILLLLIENISNYLRSKIVG